MLRLSTRVLALVLVAASVAQPLLALECASATGMTDPTTASAVGHERDDDLDGHGAHGHPPSATEAVATSEPCDTCDAPLGDQHQPGEHDHAPDGRGACVIHSMCAVSAVSIGPGMEQAFVPLHAAVARPSAEVLTADLSLDPPPPRSLR